MEARWRPQNSILAAFAVRELSAGQRERCDALDGLRRPSLCERGVYDVEAAHLVVREIEARWRAELLAWTTLAVMQAREAALVFAGRRRPAKF